MRSIAILGSTGSIGCNTLKVAEHLADVNIVAMAAGRNIELFADQVRIYKPELVSCIDEQSADVLRGLLTDSSDHIPEILCGEDGLIAVATHPSIDTVVSATVGAVGFVPTLRAIEAGKKIALANKETLVMAGELMTAAARKSGSEILPVDSEHNAIHQCLRGEKMPEVERLILTASGGPFRTRSRDEISNSTVEEALNHPNWSMGRKITIDSATLMNKGLEVIEARWLFGFDADRISVIVHPQSVIHSMVELVDGSVIAQMGVTDMRHPIQYALTYPGRQKGPLNSLDLAAVSQLTFEEPDFEKFPCLALAYEALRTGGTMPAVLNAANEVAVEAFLEKRIGFYDISRIIEAAMKNHEVRGAGDLSTILAADSEAREVAKALV
jgi:1-deoxy-D-xylulose-5-phosphate reductoisomerase